MSDVTRVLAKIEAGNQHASDELLPLVYAELRKLAAARMASERPDHTLQATGLVHEAYIRLVDDDQAQNWRSRDHFFSAAAEAMRRILIESARRKQREKRGGGMQRQDVDVDRVVPADPPDEIIAIDNALQDLAITQPTIAELVKLRYFGGLTLEEAASVVGVSPRTARRYWTYVRARLHHQLREASES